MKAVENIKNIIKKYDADNLVIGTVDYYAALYEGGAYKNFHYAESVDSLPIPMLDIAVKGENGIYKSILEEKEYVQDQQVAIQRAKEVKSKDGSIFYESSDELLSDVKPLVEVFPKMAGKKLSKKAIIKALEVKREELIKNKQKVKGTFVVRKETTTKTL